MGSHFLLSDCILTTSSNLSPWWKFVSEHLSQKKGHWTAMHLPWLHDYGLLIYLFWWQIFSLQIMFKKLCRARCGGTCLVTHLGGWGRRREDLELEVSLGYITSWGHPGLHRPCLKNKETDKNFARKHYKSGRLEHSHPKHCYQLSICSFILCFVYIL